VSCAVSALHTPLAAIGPGRVALATVGLDANRSHARTCGQPLCFHMACVAEANTPHSLQRVPSTLRYYTKRIHSDGGVYLSFIFLDSSPCVAEYRSTDKTGWDPCGSEYVAELSSPCIHPSTARSLSRPFAPPPAKVLSGRPSVGHLNAPACIGCAGPDLISHRYRRIHSPQA
jgi:hypothetical protein